MPDFSLRLQLIYKLHEEGLAGHFEHDKTFALLDERYFWPKMRKDVVKFIQGCHVCQVSKGHHQNSGLYTPLPIPERPWEHVSIDFIVGLPRTPRRFDSILVIVDRFSKMVIFAPCKRTIDASLVASYYFKDVARFHGLPRTIASDRDALYEPFLEIVMGFIRPNFSSVARITLKPMAKPKLSTAP